MKSPFFSRRVLLNLIDVLIVLCTSLFVTVCLSARNDNVGYSVAIIHAFIEAFIFILFRFVSGLYQKIWRYASAKTYLNLVACDVISSMAFYAVERLVFDYTLPTAYIAIITMASLIATVISRLIYQVLRPVFKDRQLTTLKEQIHIAIIGAGKNGAMLADTLLTDKNAKYFPYCFFDNDEYKAGRRLYGLKIYPVNDNTIELIKKMPVQEIVIAIRSLTPEDKLKLFSFYEKTGLRVRIYDVPLNDNNSETKSRIRDIHIEDLLFRDSIKVNDFTNITSYTDKTILVTGAGGSIGSELCRQLARLKPQMLVLVDIYENNVYDLQQELIRLYGREIRISVEIASVREKEKIESLFERYRPNIVFHAAAHKHVPLMERCCDEAIKNNVFGTFNVVNAAEKYHADKFIMISTDKAVNPTNIMGATKRLCEMIIQSKKHSDTVFAAVRFGNVLGSNGSVIPLFMKQIEAGGPVTITDKRIVRYFMTIPEAAQLVMQAGATAKKGEIYVLDMGKPVRILSLAENMIRLAGLRPYADIEIIEVGLREGEKLYEELLMKTEELDRTDNDKIFVERDSEITPKQVEAKLEKLSIAVRGKKNSEVRNAMMEVVPTYHDAESVNRTAIYAEEMKVNEEQAVGAE